MSDTVVDAAPNGRSPGRWAVWPIAGGLFALSALAATVFLARSRARIALSRPTVELLVAVAALLAIGVVWHIVYRWWIPRRRFLSVLNELRKGEAPIRELSTSVGGGFEPLAEPIAALLHELRAAKARINELQEEMRQRVAGRTDALERVIGSLREQAARDPLTGLYNRRALDLFLPEAMGKMVGGSDLCVLMLDVDNFKKLNDTLGHAAGDQLLKQVAQLIRSSIRENDAAFRCGGDEFVAVLPNCPAVAAQSLARRIGCLADELGRTLHLPQPPGVSVGVAALSQVAQASPQSLLRRADQELYKAKAARRQPKSAPAAAK